LALTKGELISVETPNMAINWPERESRERDVRHDDGGRRVRTRCGERTGV